MLKLSLNFYHFITTNMLYYWYYYYIYILLILYPPELSIHENDHVRLGEKYQKLKPV